MKIKTDFVTNSSSTCYIVYVPPDFKTTIKELESMLDWQLDEEDYEEDCLLKSAEDGIKSLQDGCNISFEDIKSDSFHALKYLLVKKGLVIIQVESGAGGMDSIAGIKSEAIKKLFLLTCNLKEIKEIINR